MRRIERMGEFRSREGGREAGRQGRKGGREEVEGQ